MVTTLPRHSWGGVVFLWVSPPPGGDLPLPHVPFGDVTFIQEKQKDKKIKSKKSSSELKLLIILELIFIA